MWHLLIPKCISDPRGKPKAYANPVFRPIRGPNQVHTVRVGLEAAVALNMHNLQDSLVFASSNSPLHAGLRAEGLPYMHQAPAHLQLPGEQLPCKPSGMQPAWPGTLSSSYANMTTIGPEITPATPEGYALVPDQACVKDTNRPAQFLPLGKQHPASTSSISKSNSSSGHGGAGLTHQQYRQGLQYSNQAIHTHPHMHPVAQQLATAQLAAQQAQSYASLLAQHTTAAHNTVTAKHNRLATLRVELADSAVFADSTYQTLHHEVVLLERETAAATEQFESLKQSLTAAQYEANRKQAVVEQLLQQAYSQQQQQQQVVFNIPAHTLGASLSCSQLEGGSTTGSTGLDSFTAAGRELRHSRLFIPIEAPFASLSPAAAPDAVLPGMQYSVLAPTQASVLPGGSTTSSQSGGGGGAFPMVPLPPPATAAASAATAADVAAPTADAAPDTDPRRHQSPASAKQAKTPFAGATGAAAAAAAAAGKGSLVRALSAADADSSAADQTQLDSPKAQSVRQSSESHSTLAAAAAQVASPAPAVAVQHSAHVVRSAQAADLPQADLAVANSSSAKLFKSCSGRLSEHGEPSADWSPFTRRSTSAVGTDAVQSPGDTGSAGGNIDAPKTCAFFISNGSWGGSSTARVSNGSGSSARPPARASRNGSVRGVGNTTGGGSSTSTSSLAARRASLNNSSSSSSSSSSTAAGRSTSSRPTSAVEWSSRSSSVGSASSKALANPGLIASAAVERNQRQSAPDSAGIGLRASSKIGGRTGTTGSGRALPAAPVGRSSAVTAERMATTAAARRMSSPGSISATKGTAAGPVNASSSSSSKPCGSTPRARWSTTGAGTNSKPTGSTASKPRGTSGAGRNSSLSGAPTGSTSAGLTGRNSSSNISLRSNSQAGAAPPNGRYSSTGSAASRYSSTDGTKGRVQRYSSSTDSSSSSDSDSERDSLSQAARLASRRLRQPGDLAPHVAKLHEMYAEEVSAEWEGVKGNLKGRRKQLAGKAMV